MSKRSFPSFSDTDKMDITYGEFGKYIAEEIDGCTKTLESELSRYHEAVKVMRENLEIVTRWKFATDGKKFDGNHKEVLKTVIGVASEALLEADRILNFQNKGEK